MTRTTTLKSTFARNDRHTFQTEYHLIGCRCQHCQPVPPPLPIAKLTIAGIIVGNLIAFAYDAHGAAAALASTIGVQI